jgi:hypothetical protein
LANEPSPEEIFMILELADFSIQPGQNAAFEEAIQRV